MNTDDKRDFRDLLAGTLDVYGRAMTREAAGIWWAAMEPYPLADVRAAFSRYVCDPDQGKFPPTPGAVLALMPASGGRAALGADEAWGLALLALDERESVCVTAEVMAGVTAARPVWEIGDKIGARMAFKAAHERAEAERRAQGRVAHWFLSVGWDGEGRERAAQEALRLGRMSPGQVAAYLPAPEPAGAAAVVAGLLSGKVVEFPVSGDEKTRRHLAELREVLAGAVGARAQAEAERASAAVDERARFEARRASALAEIERISQGQGRDREAG